MMLMEVLTYPNPELKVTAHSVNKVDSEIGTLIDNMIETMYHENGIGLAATQVGVEKRVIILDVPDNKTYEEAKFESQDETNESNLMAVINPEILNPEGETSFEEGCLSVPGYTANVKRYETLTLTGMDRDGKKIEKECHGLLAVAVQHEIDHLNGVLFIDRLSPLKRQMAKKKLKKALLEDAEMV